MKAGYVQISPIFGDKLGNIEKALLLMKAGPADIYVLPELFATGYLILTAEEALTFSESPDDGITFKLLMDFASSRRCALIFGFAERGEGKIYNSCAFID